MIPKTVFRIVLSSTLPLLLAVGCAHQWPESSASSSPALKPTSDSDAQRVYSTTVTAPGGAEGTVTIGANTASAEDRDIAETVRKMIMEDQSLAPYPSKVSATMDANPKGTVILSGWVPTQQAKKKLRDRVAALPGVTRVEDRVVVGLAPKAGEFDPDGPRK